jgi:hypothetical protein
MANPEHVEILKQGAEAWNKWRKVYPEVVPDLAKAYLVGTNLCRANLYGAKLSDADLSESKLLEVELSDADLTAENLSNSDLRKSKLIVAKAGMTNFKAANLGEAELFGTNFIGAKFNEANLSYANCTGASFLGADLTNAILHGVGLWGTARDNWEIRGILCTHIYDDATCILRIPKDRDFEEGEFENLYASLPSFEYIFENGMQPLDPVFMSQVAENIKTQNPEFELEIDSISARGLKPSIKFVVNHEHKESAEQAVIENYEKTIARLEGGKEELQKMLDKYMGNNTVKITGGNFTGTNIGPNLGTQTWNLTQIDNSTKLDEDTKSWLKSVAGKLQNANLDEAEQTFAQTKLEAFQSEIEKDQKDESKIQKTWKTLVALAPDIQKLSTLPKSINEIIGPLLGG